MCGIVGYIGHRQAQDILINSLKKLEYRGYDSCGLAISGSSIKVFKDILRVGEIAKIIPRFRGTRGIGHTRWATCGPPSRINAHPHCDCSGNIAVVHNGVINNFEKLKAMLSNKGHKFVAETDTEVISHLVEQYYNGDLEGAVKHSLEMIDGSYALIVLKSDEPRLVVARKDSPLVIGVGDREYFIASDVTALLDYTKDVVFLEDGDMGSVNKLGIELKRNGNTVKRGTQRVWWTAEEAKKGGYDHFMLKEIHEQPRVIRDTLVNYSQRSDIITKVSNKQKVKLEAALILACGTSYHAGLVGKYILEELLNIPVSVEAASEFHYHGQILKNTLAIAISQSGETADILKAVKTIKNAGHNILAISNAMGSTISRLADQVVYTRAGPEISVASTKTFTAQLIVLYWLAIAYSNSYFKADVSKSADMLMSIRQLPDKVQQILNNKEKIMKWGRYLAQHDSVFFAGRGINYPIALEGALKLKEISYIHAEGYAAGELKHGPFALLERSIPVIAVIGHDATYEAMLNNVREIKARNAKVIAITFEDDRNDVSQLADDVITIPQIDAIFSPVLNSVVLQLLAYYIAKERDCPIDFPRNLAKSVTVE
jgi:glutamine---fructose-6-phosphate transaminase (isomerizing)